MSSISDRIATIADEAFGPFPVQTDEENLTAIEKGIAEQGRELEEARADADELAEAIHGTCTIDTDCALVAIANNYTEKRNRINAPAVHPLFDVILDAVRPK